MKGTVAILGSVCVDEVVGGPRPGCRLGGVTTYAGLTYLRHDCAVQILGRVAAEHSAALSSALRAVGAAVTLSEGADTSWFVNRIDGDRRWQRMRSTSEPIQRALVTPAVAAASVIHLGPLHPKDIAVDVLSAVEATRAVVVLDVQGLTRAVSADGRVDAAVAPELEAFLQRSDIVKADDAELALVCRTLEASPARLCQRYGVRELIETRASSGGRIHAGGGIVPYDAVPVAGSVDATGAGDVFLAAYVCARVFARADLGAAAATAAATAGMQVTGRYVVPPALPFERAELDPAQD